MVTGAKSFEEERRTWFNQKLCPEEKAYKSFCVCWGAGAEGGVWPAQGHAGNGEAGEHF